MKNATGSPRNEKYFNHVLYTHPPADLPLVIVFGIVCLTLKLTFLVMVSSPSNSFQIIAARHLLPIVLIIEISATMVHSVTTLQRSVKNVRFKTLLLFVPGMK